MNMGQECKYVVRKNSGAELKSQVICAAKKLICCLLKNLKKEGKRRKKGITVAMI